MKKYQCHKQVEAFKIDKIVQPKEHNPAFPQGSWVLAPDIGQPVTVGHDWFTKHNPQIGGYFVRYADGYESYSPAQAFVNGYTEISE
jgi:hypothetical protein